MPSPRRGISKTEGPTRYNRLTRESEGDYYYNQNCKKLPFVETAAVTPHLTSGPIQATKQTDTGSELPLSSR